MISQEKDSIIHRGTEILNRVEERLAEGCTVHREVMTDEIRPLIIAAIHWRNIACNLWDEKTRRDMDSMSLGPVPEKYAQKQEQ